MLKSEYLLQLKKKIFIIAMMFLIPYKGLSQNKEYQYLMWPQGIVKIHPDSMISYEGTFQVRLLEKLYNIQLVSL